METQNLKSILQLLQSCCEVELRPIDAMKLAIQTGIYDNSCAFETELFTCYQDARAGLNNEIAIYIKRVLAIYQDETYPLK